MKTDLPLKRLFQLRPQDLLRLMEACAWVECALGLAHQTADNPVGGTCDLASQQPGVDLGGDSASRGGLFPRIDQGNTEILEMSDVPSCESGASGGGDAGNRDVPNLRWPPGRAQLCRDPGSCLCGWLIEREHPPTELLNQ